MASRRPIIQPDRLNTTYWQTLPAEEIIGDNALPDAELLELLPDGAAILDLGCGNGKLAEHLFAYGYHVSAVDANPAAINQDRLRNPAINYTTCDVTSGLPYPDASFDAVTISFVLVNIIGENFLKKVVSEVKRVLKSDGLVWVNEGLVSDDYTDRYRLYQQIASETQTFFVTQRGVRLEPSANAQELQKALADGRIVRVAHHFSLEELHGLFNDFTLLGETNTCTRSPNTGATINMATIVFRKT